MRATDKKFKRHFQSTRYFRVNHKWYFQTREGQDYGPYDTRDMAEFECMQYIHLSGMELKFLHDHEQVQAPQYPLSAKPFLRA